MSSKQPRNYDQNVSPNWKPVAGLQDRKPGMHWSDRLWHWLVSLGGLAMMGCGIAWIAYIPFKRIGLWLIVGGLVVFMIGFPNQAQRNGYRG